MNPAGHSREKAEGSCKKEISVWGMVVAANCSLEHPHCKHSVINLRGLIR